MKSRILSVIIAVFCLCFASMPAKAEDTADVALYADVAQNLQTLEGTVTVQFHRQELYNEGVKLSWHIYSDGGELLVFENERYPLAVENGTAVVPVKIELPQLEAGSAVIRFDLVDEENVYWFSDSPALTMQQDEVHFAQQRSAVTIEGDFPADITRQRLEGNLSIWFENPALYHEQVKVSWHIYGADGTCLAYENERLALPPLEDGKTTVPIAVDFSSSEAVSGEKAFTLRFDLVDEKNGFWFSEYGPVALQAAEARYQYRLGSEMLAVMKYAVTEQPLLLGLNAAADLLLVTGIVLLRRRKKQRKLGNREKPSDPPKKTGSELKTGTSSMARMERKKVHMPGRLKKLRDNKNMQYWIIAILSMLIFISIYGTHILNPTYTDWLLSGGDLSQHYLGWRGYRSSSWLFPIGMMDTLVYPDATSIIFTDSIPLFAVFFKILSPVLPEQFQYFGLWGIMCFALQGLLAARILRNYTENKNLLVVSSLLFVFTPVMIGRMFGHTSLAGHWILLLGLEPIFAYKKYHGNKKIYAVAALIGFLSASVHIYFVLISGIILIGVCTSNLLFYKEIRKGICTLSIYIVSAATTVALLGGFSSGIQASGWGLGHYSFNLNALFNPMGWSDIYKDLPLYGSGQYEGFAYLGAGVILFLIFACVSFVGDSDAKRVLKKCGRSAISLFAIVIIALFIAQSPLVTVGDKVLLDMKVPDFVMKLWSIFRASGRMAWIAVYVVMLTSTIMIYKMPNKTARSFLLVIGVVLQIYDIHSMLNGKNAIFNRTVIYESQLRNETFWENIADENFQHIIYVSPVDTETMYSVTDWALDNQMTLNAFYLAHAEELFNNGNTAEILAQPAANDLFIFREGDNLKLQKYNLNYYQVDGLIVGCLNQIPELPLMESKKLNRNIWRFGNGTYLSDGTDTDDGRLLYPGGLSYGPYWFAPSGSYNLTITGEDLSDMTEVIIYSQYGALYHDFDVISKSDTEIQVQLLLDKDVDNLEILVRNTAEREIMLRSIELNHEK